MNQTSFNQLVCYKVKKIYKIIPLKFKTVLDNYTFSKVPRRIVAQLLSLSIHLEEIVLPSQLLHLLGLFLSCFFS